MPKSFPPDIVAPSSELKSHGPLTSEAVNNAIENDLHRHKEIASSNINSIRAVASITGTNGSGVIGTSRIFLPVTSLTTTSSTNGSCPILNLTLGLINLNLLGLVVKTNTIHLSITAQPGAGNLLGNLLCDIANLLNNNDLANVTNDLNILLTLL